MLKFVTGESEVAFLGAVVRRTAGALGHPDVDFYGDTELLDWLSRAHPTPHVLLTAFLEAHWRWFKIHAEIDRRGLAGELDAATSAKLRKAFNGTVVAMRRWEFTGPKGEVSVTPGMRISPSVYNNQGDIDRLLEALAYRLRKML